MRLLLYSITCSNPAVCDKLIAWQHFSIFLLSIYFIVVCLAPFCWILLWFLCFVWVVVYLVYLFLSYFVWLMMDWICMALFKTPKHTAVIHIHMRQDGLNVQALEGEHFDVCVYSRARVSLMFFMFFTLLSTQNQTIQTMMGKKKLQFTQNIIYIFLSLDPHRSHSYLASGSLLHHLVRKVMKI